MQTLQQLKDGQLVGCKRLQLVEQLTDFPEEIFTLADSLEILDLSNNLISQLPDNLHQLHQLKILFLSNNQFQHLPDSLGACPQLEMIGFKNNQIKTIAANALPPQTKWLILTDNQIQALPDNIGQLHRLQKLLLAGNQLITLPGSMADCQNLELIRLSANQLNSLPDWLFQLPKLAWCAFSGNPATANNKNADMLKVTLDDISLVEQIGEGASGFIHKAQWRNQPPSLQHTPNDIALKLFKGSVTSDGYPSDELNCCLSAGAHPNLIKVIAQISQPEQLALVMELIPDNFKNLGLPPTLKTCTRDTFASDAQFSLNNIIKVAIQMADTLEHLHQQQVSHGDIYAHNTMIDEQFQMLFGDFGAASNLSQLPPAQQQAMAKIEVRAFGCLLEDLLQQCPQPFNHVKSTLSTIKDQCLQMNVQQRPNWPFIKARLAELC